MTMGQLCQSHVLCTPQVVLWVGSAGVFETAGVLFETAGVLFETAGVLLETAGVLLETAGVLLETAGVLFETAGVLFETAWLLQLLVSLSENSSQQDLLLSALRQCWQADTSLKCQLLNAGHHLL